MLVFRPVETGDLDQLVHLATLADYGLTTLPTDRDYLEKKVLQSTQSFERSPDEPGGETYFFVAEDLESGQVVGTSGIVSRVGGFEPFYMYEIKTVLHESSTLGVHKEIQVLHLVAEHDGPCEIGTLFLSPHYRRSGVGRFLSRSRFLFMADYSQAFAEMVIAEMRGVSDATGQSPFWEGLGRHFFDIDFPKADYLSILNKKFIAELMPTHPIYISLLPDKAQAVIGHVHEKTMPALKILEVEGFAFGRMVDIFDAGPIVRCPLAELKTVRESVQAKVLEVAEGQGETDSFIITNGQWD
ncbi:MAG: arginine N-succinyltransferase, partial [bacterium]|nr:arginine N-succinyltransferase [bacterium]